MRKRFQEPKYLSSPDITKELEDDVVLHCGVNQTPETVLVLWWTGPRHSGVCPLHGQLALRDEKSVTLRGRKYQSYHTSSHCRLVQQRTTEALPVDG